MINVAVIAEEWRDIEGYEGLYQVSSFGRVKSFYKWNGHKHIYKEHIIEGYVQTVRKSYARRVVNLTNCKGERKMFKVHRLVANAFIENPNNYNVINHIDGNPLNNYVSNLEWCTPKHNAQHAIENKLKKCATNRDDLKEIIDSYIKFGKNYTTKKYNLTTENLDYIRKKYGIKANRKMKNTITKYDVIEDIKAGRRNVDIAMKYNCSKYLIGVWKYNLKKEGFI